MQLRETDKFTDTSLAVRTILPLKKETITALNVLLYAIRGKTEKYETKQKFAMAVNDAYAFKVIYGLTGYGPQVLLDIRLQYIRSELVQDPEYLPKVAELMEQVLFHPRLDEAGFEEARYQLINRLRRLQDDADSLAVMEALRQLPEGESISVPMTGELEDLEKLTYADVQETLRAYEEAPRLVFAIGKPEPEVMEVLARVEETPVKLECRAVPAFEPVRQVIEKDISQSSIVQIYATGITLISPDYPVLVVLNSLLGASPTSLLFTEVREKHSYCYRISSSIMRYDGALMISTGTDKENIQDVLRLIQEQISRLRTGDFSDEDLRIARDDLIDGIRLVQDRPFSLLEKEFSTVVLGRRASEAQSIERIEKVSREQIMELAGQLQLISEVIVETEEEADVQS